MQVYFFFGVFYITRYFVFYYLLDPFPQASCHCIRKFPIIFCPLFKGSFVSDFSYLTGQLLLPRTRNSIWQVYH